jgi:hypothetical protein
MLRQTFVRNFCEKEPGCPSSGVCELIKPVELGLFDFDVNYEQMKQGRVLDLPYSNT